MATATMLQTRSDRRQVAKKRSMRHSDEWIVAGVALCISIAAFTYYYLNGATLLYPDSVAHMEIARRFLDSPTPGFGQLGGVWLPLPHMLMVPFVWCNPLYYSGLAGSVINMASYVLAAVYLYKIVHGLTGYRAPAYAGAAVFAFNPNILYMQSTPMTELLLFVSMLAMVYYVQRWIQTDRYQPLFLASAAALVGSLTRYEAWVLIAALSLVVAGVAWKRHGYRYAEGKAISFALLGWLGIIGWVVWNWLIFDNPLNWQNGAYAKSSLWVGSNEPALGDLWISIQTYWYAVVDNLGLIVMVAGGAGFFALVAIRRKLDALPTLSLLVLWPFFVYALYTGQRPMHVMQISNDLYNVRFGLLIVLPAAIGVGYLVSLVASLSRKVVIGVSGAVVAGLMAVLMVSSTSVVVREPQVWAIAARKSESTKVAAFLKQNYDRGTVLATFFGNESVLFDSRISLGENIYEGSYKQWNRALEQPKTEQVRWIVLRDGDTSDEVFVKLSGSRALDSYRLVYNQDGYQVYRER